MNLKEIILAGSLIMPSVCGASEGAVEEGYRTPRNAYYSETTSPLFDYVSIGFAGLTVGFVIGMYASSAVRASKEREEAEQRLDF